MNPTAGYSPGLMGQRFAVLATYRKGATEGASPAQGYNSWACGGAQSARSCRKPPLTLFWLFDDPDNRSCL